MERYYIYEHVRLDRNEVFYVGKGTVKKTNPYGRSQEKSRRSDLWKKVINKTDYEIRIVFEDEDEKVVFSKEVELIKLYGRKDLSLGPLVNFTDGGDGTSGAIRSDEFKKKVSNFHSNKKVSNETKLLIQEKRKNQVMTKEHCKNISLGLMGKTKGKPSPLKGTVRPQEVGEKISKSKLGHTVSDETRIKLSQKLKGNTYQTNVLVLDGTLKNFILDNPTMGYRKISNLLGIGKNTVLKMKRELLHIIK
jgi:hypothetical protein